MSFWGYFFTYASVLTYITWGLVVSFEVNLVMAGSEFAKEWVRKRYTLKFFMFEIYIFFPMVIFGYLFLEVIPYMLGKSDKLSRFDIAGTIYKVFEDEIDEAGM
jgi:hypothetical protein